MAWAKLLSKLEAGLSRLRSLHKVSLRDFYVVSEAILNGLVGAACQTLYLTFEQCEVVEAKWRAIVRVCCNHHHVLEREAHLWFGSGLGLGLGSQGSGYGFRLGVGAIAIMCLSARLT